MDTFDLGDIVEYQSCDSSWTDLNGSIGIVVTLDSSIGVNWIVCMAPHRICRESHPYCDNLLDPAKFRLLTRP